MSTIVKVFAVLVVMLPATTVLVDTLRAPGNHGIGPIVSYVEPKAGGHPPIAMEMMIEEMEL